MSGVTEAKTEAPGIVAVQDVAWVVSMGTLVTLGEFWEVEAGL